MKTSRISQALIFAITAHLIAFGVLWFARYRATLAESHATQNLDVSWGHTQPAPKAAPLAAPPAASQISSNTTTGNSSGAPRPGAQSAQGSAPSEQTFTEISVGDPYYGKIRAKIQAQLIYPPQLLRRRITGRSVIALAIRADGTLASSEITLHSGHDELDQQALQAVRNAAPFDSFSAAEKNRKLLIPLDFELRR